jgi:hypothetical protein
MNAPHSAPLALKRLRIAWTAAIAAGAVSPAAAQIDIQAIVLPPPLNNSAQAYTARPGEAAGAIDFGNDPLNRLPHPAVWRNGIAELLPVPDGHNGRVRGSDGDAFAGFTRGPTGSAVIATLWVGPSRERVELNPPGERRAALYQSNGGQQVGFVGTSATVPLPGLGNYQQPYEAGEFVSVYALSPEPPRATLWHGTPDSAVDLHPAGATASAAIDTDGNRQVGVFYNGEDVKPALWDDTAASFRALPLGPWARAAAVGIDGDLIVGYANFRVSADAEPVIWVRGWSEPLRLATEFGCGYALDVEGNVIVGQARRSFTAFDAAVLWLDPLASPIDLHALLPPWTYVGSIARHITEDSGRLIVTGTAIRYLGFGNAYRSEPVTWIVTIPEPRTGMLLGVLAALPVVRRRRAWPGTAPRA